MWEILSDFDETQCIWWLAYGVDERCSVPTIVEEYIHLFISSVVFCHAMPRIQYVKVFFSTGKYTSVFEVNSISPSSAVARNAWR